MNGNEREALDAMTREAVADGLYDTEAADYMAALEQARGQHSVAESITSACRNKLIDRAYDEDERHELLRVFFEMPGDVTAVCSCGRYFLDNLTTGGARGVHAEHAASMAAFRELDGPTQS